MTDPIDYSRPVGWWCLHCDEHFPCERVRMWLPMACKLIPVYLPIPEGQRPLVEDEVTTGEAEVCTGSLSDGSPCCWVTVDAVYAPDNGWLASIVHLAEYADADHINDIAQASARARIVTGATE